ncbi:hypothetical protein SADUNF_Sadunf14G0027800 [Salix dunnii]|uniref:Uncharacterized protein n=1 Tax=Salix dunnii TaxID=1413687 RepID=A0A835JDS6_9ROSI|nr:hypothetical protein SADUNF_Sadunf14G0027800 [Salix dunnii]
MKPVRKPVPKFPKQSPDHPPIQKSSSHPKRKVLVRLLTTPSENVVGPPTVHQQQKEEEEGGVAKVVTSSSENKKDTRIKKQGFSISLTKEEIELDFLKLAGVKPKRKPRKRDKDVQTALDSTFPGLKLQTITFSSTPQFRRKISSSGGLEFTLVPVQVPLQNSTKYCRAVHSQDQGRHAAVGISLIHINDINKIIHRFPEGQAAYANLPLKECAISSTISIPPRNLMTKEEFST